MATIGRHIISPYSPSHSLIFQAGFLIENILCNAIAMSKTPSGHHDLDRQAIQRAAAAFAQLRDGSQLFRECVADTNTIEELIKSIEINHQHRRKKASSRLLATFHRHTAGLRTLSGAINVAVQTQAEFACPLCAPIKFFLVVSIEVFLPNIV